MKYYKTKYLFYFMRLGKPVDLGSISHISKALQRKCTKESQARTIYVITQSSLELSQSVSSGPELQKPKTQRDAGRRRDQIGVVLCLGECLVEADTKPRV